MNAWSRLLVVCFLLVFSVHLLIEAKIVCRKRSRAAAATTFAGDDKDLSGWKELQPSYSQPAWRKKDFTVYLWPSLAEHEQAVLRDAFAQIAKRTCVRFDLRPYQKWYHAERWEQSKPYILIRKSVKYSAFTDNEIENTVQRTILYITSGALNQPGYNESRGQVIDQLLRFLDAPSYIQPIRAALYPESKPAFSSEQLQWPFDPESVTIPSRVRDQYMLTEYCTGRRNGDIGAGQRAGILTKWDALKVNSLYCPDTAHGVDPRYGPCVLPRPARRRKIHS